MTSQQILPQGQFLSSEVYSVDLFITDNTEERLAKGRSRAKTRKGRLSATFPQPGREFLLAAFDNVLSYKARVVILS